MIPLKYFAQSANTLSHFSFVKFILRSLSSTIDDSPLTEQFVSLDKSRRANITAGSANRNAAFNPDSVCVKVLPLKHKRA